MIPLRISELLVCEIIYCPPALGAPTDFIRALPRFLGVRRSQPAFFFDGSGFARARPLTRK